MEVVSIFWTVVLSLPPLAMVAGVVVYRTACAGCMTFHRFEGSVRSSLNAPRETDRRAKREYIDAWRVRTFSQTTESHRQVIGDGS
jgi:hypothetical protein